MVSVAASMTLHCMFARSAYLKVDETKILVASWTCLASQGVCRKESASDVPVEVRPIQL
jgi:hypothetical protein